MFYRSYIERIVGEEFKSYQLKIEINEVNAEGIPSRNFYLNKL